MAKAKKEEKIIDPSEQLASFLKNNKKHHYNFEEDIYYKVSFGSLKLDIELGGIGPGFHRFCGRTEGGKSVPVNTFVFLPNGQKEHIGNIKVGDKIMGKNGLPTKVTGVFPQGKLDVFEVKFSDDTSAYCSNDHLWAVKNINDRINNFPNQVLPLSEIRKKIMVGKHKNYSIDFCDPVQFEKKKLPISPYPLGALLGDGCFCNQKSNVTLSTKDDFILNKVISDLGISKKNNVSTNNNKDYRFKGISLKNDLKKLNLFGKKSEEKFIPLLYLTSSVKDRIELLKGLMDTDGNVDKKGKGSRSQFCTVSERLKNDFVYLVRSLGGSATTKERKPFYYDKNRKRIYCKKAFIVTVSFTNEINPFSLPRKADIFRPKTKRKYKYIESVRKLSGKIECVCIKVDAPDSLFLIDDFIATHNTSEALEVCKNFLKEPGRRAVYVKCEGRLGPEMRARSGVKFVSGDPTKEGDAWVDGTCYVHESNIFESVLTMIKNLVENNPTKTKYLFIIDSLDTMIREDDVDKAFGKAHQVGGGATIMSHFFKHMALPTSKYGHMMIMLSQVRKDIPASQYVAARSENYSGGNAAMHQPDLTLEFLSRGSANGDNYFTENEGKPSENNRIIGHNCRVRVEKSMNEKSKMEFTYPIRYGRTGGRSIWVEKEVINLLLAFEMLVKKASWFSFDEHTANVAISEGVKNKAEDGESVLKKQYQGQQAVEDMFTANPEVLEYFYNTFKEQLKNQF